MWPLAGKSGCDNDFQTSDVGLTSPTQYRGLDRRGPSRVTARYRHGDSSEASRLCELRRDKFVDPLEAVVAHHAEAASVVAVALDVGAV